jgi:hypothetical protein
VYNKALSAIRADSYILSIIRYQSLVIGLTDPNAPAHFATLLVHRLSFGLISNFVFLYCISTGRTKQQIPKLRQCSR